MKIKPTQHPGRVVLELESKDETLLEKTNRFNASPVLLKLKKILIPVDFSECSRKALRYAIPLARQFGARLILLHVVQMNYAYGESMALDYSLLERQLIDAGAEQLARVARNEIEEAIPSETLVRNGGAAREIVAAARELECDLIIISTHGHTGLKHVFLGSTTERVVRHAPCPVLVVREREHEFAGDENE